MQAKQIDDERRSLLVPVDFSPCSTAALVFASHLVEMVRSPLLVLHVVHESAQTPGYYRKHDHSGRMVPLEEVADNMMKEYLDELRNKTSGLEILESVRTLLVKGQPAERIREVAARENVAMVVMGSHGHTGLPAMLLGSVAQQVTKHSSIPVTIVREPNNGWEGRTAYDVGSAEWWQKSPARDAAAG